jgi:hypothetical protein
MAASQLITRWAARTPENPDPRSWFGSVTTEPGHPLQPVINRGADRWQPDGTELAQPVTEEVFASDDTLWLGLSTTVLVEALLQRGDDADFKAAHFTIERLAAVATDSASVLHELPQLRKRALLAHARAAEAGYMTTAEWPLGASECNKSQTSQTSGDTILMRMR